MQESVQKKDIKITKKVFILLIEIFLLNFTIYLSLSKVFFRGLFK